MSGDRDEPGGGGTAGSSDEPGLLAHRCPDGHLTYPGHPRCPECGREQVGTVDLADRTATVVTWTTSTATPPGVRAPNHLAVVEFDVDDVAGTDGGGADADDGETDDGVVDAVDGGATDADGGTDDGVAGASVRAIGQLTTGDVETGDAVRPVYVPELRDPEAGIRHPDSQSWDGYRFEPV